MNKVNKIVAMLLSFGFSMHLIGCTPDKKQQTVVPSPNSIATPEVTQPIMLSEEDQIKNEIIEKSKIAELYRKLAAKIDDLEAVGTAYNDLDFNEHSCGVMGRLLGKKNAVSHLTFTYQADSQLPSKNFWSLVDEKKIYSPNTHSRSSDIAHDLRVSAISIDNWVYVAEEKLKESKIKMSEEWNLDCVGKYGIKAGFVKTDGKKTFYEYDSQSKTIRVLGDIEESFSNDLIAAIGKHPDVDTIALGSGGGVVVEAIKAGNFIRARKLNTTLWNGCYSACPLVFFGGVNRMIPSPYPVVGFHQISSGGVAVSRDSKIYYDVFQYVNSKGVDAEYVLSLMHSSAPSKMTVKDGFDENLCKYKIATWIQRSPSNYCGE